MIIDFHTHAFPDKIADQAIAFLKDNSRTIPFTDGRYSSLSKRAKGAGVLWMRKRGGNAGVARFLKFPITKKGREIAAKRERTKRRKHAAEEEI